MKQLTLRVIISEMGEVYQEYATPIQDGDVYEAPPPFEKQWSADDRQITVRVSEEDWDEK